MTLLTLTALLLGQLSPAPKIWDHPVRPLTMTIDAPNPRPIYFTINEGASIQNCYTFTYDYPSGDMVISGPRQGWSIRMRAKDGHVFWSGKTPDKASREFWDAITMLRKQLPPKDLK